MITVNNDSYIVANKASCCSYLVIMINVCIIILYKIIWKGIDCYTIISFPCVETCYTSLLESLQPET